MYATSSAQFWGDLEVALREVKRVACPGGRVVIVVQPMGRGATAGDARSWSARLGASLLRAGFVDISARERTLYPLLAVAALARAA